MDRYIAWARTWGRGHVVAVELPESKAWAMGEPNGKLATYTTACQVITFTNKKSAERCAIRANEVMDGKRRP